MRRKPAPELTIWRPDGLPAVEALLGEHCGHPYPRHWHEEFLLSSITAGSGSFHHRGCEHRVFEGCTFFVSPGEVHANYAGEEGCSFRSVYLPAALVREAVAEFGGTGCREEGLPSGLLDDAEIRRAYLYLHRGLRQRATVLHRDTAMLRFLMFFVQRQSPRGSFPPRAGREPKAVQQAREFLHEHYDRGVALKELAQLTGLTPFRLHRAFCAELGIPPHQYQIQVRIARVKPLLRDGWPIAMAACAVGFTDQSHLARHFKRLVGVTPGDYYALARTSNTVS